MQAEKQDALILENDPRLIEFCVNCRKDDCNGECAAYYAMRRKIQKKDMSVALYTYDGITMTMSEWAKRIGMTYSGFYHRMSARGMTFAQAIEMGPPKENGVRHEAFGKSQTIAEWCREYGIQKDTLRRRLRVGMSLEKALTVPVQVKFRKGARE